MKRNTLKRTLAGVLAVLCVAAYAPVELGSNGLFGSAAIPASAEGEIQQQSLVGTEIMIGKSFKFEDGIYYKDNNGSVGQFDGKTHTLGSPFAISVSGSTHYFTFKAFCSTLNFRINDPTNGYNQANIKGLRINGGEGTSSKPYTFSAIPVLEGKGTDDDPYKITSAADITAYLEENLYNSFYNTSYLQLQNDVTLDEPLTVSKDKKMTIDLNGHTLNGRIKGSTINENGGTYNEKLNLKETDYIAPEAVSGLKYTGDGQELITPGSTKKAGTVMKYSLLEDGVYSEALPKAANPGVYTVWYMVDGGEDYNSTEPKSMTVKIVEGDTQVDTDISINAYNINYAGVPYDTGYIDINYNNDQAKKLKENNPELTYTYYDSNGTELLGAPTDAGSYSVKVTIHDITGTFSDRTLSDTFEINKYSLDIIINSKSAAYGVTLEDLHKQWYVTNYDSGLLSEDEKQAIVERVQLVKDSEVISEGRPDAGTYSFQIKAADDTAADILRNYEVKFSRESFTVNKHNLASNGKITAVYSEPVYNGQEQAPEFKLVYQYDADSEPYTLVEGTDYTAYVESRTDVGTYYADFIGKGNFGNTKTVRWNIQKATPTVTAPTGKYLSQTDSEQELVDAGSTDFGTLLYSLDGENYSADIPKAAEARTYTVYYKVEGSDNWNAVDPQTVTATITEEQPKLLAQNTVSFQENLKLNFLADIPDDCVQGAYVKLTYNHYGTPTEVKVDIDPTNKHPNGCYRFPCELTASEMAVEVKAELYLASSDVPVSTATRSIRDYCIVGLGESADDTEKALFKAALNYGGYTQKHFGYNGEPYANAGYQISTEGVDVKSEVEFTRPEGIKNGIEYCGASVFFKSAPYVRYYFKLTEGADIGSYEFLIDGDKKTPGINNGYYYIEAAPALAYKLDEPENVVVKQGNTEVFNFNYSVIRWAESAAVQSEKDTEKEMVRSLYQYYTAAKAYVEKNS